MVKRDLVAYIILFLALIAGAIAIRVYVVEPHTVTVEEANSYIKEGQMVLAFKPAEVAHNDFVLYKVDGKEHIGRVIAMPGDTVIYMDDVLYLNNEIQDEPYLETFKSAHQSNAAEGDYFTNDFTIQTLTQTMNNKVPTDEYLILNDNRVNTSDSRDFGLIGKVDIVGVISFRISPLDDFGFVDSL